MQTITQTIPLDAIDPEYLGVVTADDAGPYLQKQPEMPTPTEMRYLLAELAKCDTLSDYYRNKITKLLNRD